VIVFDRDELKMIEHEKNLFIFGIESFTKLTNVANL